MSDALFREIDRLIEQGTLLARTCRVPEARDTLQRAAVLVGPEGAPRHHVSLQLAESFCLFFEHKIDEAIALNRQAAAAAQAIGALDIECNCDATLALFYTTSARLEDSLRFSQRVLQRAAPDDHLSRCRAHMALASVMQIADLPEAFIHYRQARDHARHVHDDMAVAASFHRMATAQALAARLAFEGGRLDDEALKQAIVGIQSSLQTLASISPTLTTVIENLMLAELLLMRGDIEEATALYERYVPQARREGHLTTMSHCLASFALCKLRMGRVDEARVLLKEAQSVDNDDTKSLIGALLYRGLETAYRWLGDTERQAHFDALARDAWVRYGQQQQHWRELIAAHSEVQ